MFGFMWRWFWWSGGGHAAVITAAELVQRLSELKNIIKQFDAYRFGFLFNIIQRKDVDIRLTGNHIMPILKTVFSKTAAEIVTYIFDFSNFPEVLNGETISNPVVSVSGSGLTTSGVIVTTSKIEGVPTGQGVLTTVSGGSAGSSYEITCQVDMSGGDVRVVKGIIVVE